MTSWQASGLVASREVSTRIRSKGYLISTVVAVVMLVGFAVVMKAVGGSVSNQSVGVTPTTAALAPGLRAAGNALGLRVTVHQVTSEAVGLQQVRDGALDGLLVGTGDRIQVVVKQDITRDLRDLLGVLAGQLTLNQQIIDLHGDPAKVRAATQEAGVRVLPLLPPHNYQTQQLILGIIAGILIYMSLMINGQGLAQGVVEEKSSRVVELLLATVRPAQLMAGKVLGIGLVGLIQIAVIGAAGVAAGLTLGALTISVSAAVSTVAWLVTWYLLGFLMYAIVIAALAALVSRQEDASGVVMPALMLVVLGYALGVSVLPADPGSSLIAVLSLIPVFAPTLMPMRLAMGGVPGWQEALAVVLVVAVIPVLIWLSGRIYRNAVLRTGARVRWAEALRPA